MTSPNRHIAVFFTGGTIGMDMTDGGVAPDAGFMHRMLTDLATGPSGAAVRPVHWGDRPSPHMTPRDMFRLAGDVDAALAHDYCLGAVVLHGTDVLVESAFMLDLLVTSDKPVVVTGSMRYYGESGYDGMRNLVNSLRAVALPLPPGLGAVVLMTDRLFAARDVAKVNSLNVDAFEAREAGLVGFVAGEDVLLRRTAHRERVVLRPERLEARVPLLACYTGMDSALLFAALEGGARGLVLEGFGAGNVPPGVVDGVRAFCDRGLPVVLATRCLEGGVWPIYGYPGGAADLRDLGVILSGRLGGPKARLLLMLGLGAGLDDQGLRALYGI